MISTFPGPLKFGAFEFDPVSGELRRHGLAVRLTPQSTTLLRVLLERPLRVRTRDEIRGSLWPGQLYLDFEHGLNKVVHSLREALGDTGNNPRFIVTVAAKGYYFIPESLEVSSPLAIQPSAELCLAILPVGTTSHDPEMVFLSRRLTSALTDAISEGHRVRVIAEAIVRSCSSAAASPQRIGEMLGVRTVLWGEMMVHQQEVFLRMELIDVCAGTHLAGVRVQEKFSVEMFPYAEIVQKTVLQLEPVLHTITGLLSGVD